LPEANNAYAESFDQGGLPMPPARGVAIVTCMDARSTPSVRDDVETIRNSPFIPEGVTVSGYINDVNTGARQTVVEAGT
jgi:carbonic anhydrase